MVDFNEEDCTPHWGEFVDKVKHILNQQKFLMVLFCQGCPAKGSKTRVGAKRPRDRAPHTKIVSSVFNLVFGTLNASKIGGQCVSLPLQTFRVSETRRPSYVMIV